MEFLIRVYRFISGNKQHNIFLFLALAEAISGNFCKAESEIFDVVDYIVNEISNVVYYKYIVGGMEYADDISLVWGRQ